MTRRWPLPNPARTIHVVGDTHFGPGTANALTDSRQAQILADLAGTSVPPVQYHLQVGDLTNTAIASQDALALAFMDQVKGDGERLLVVGNHDMYTRTAAESMAAWGLTGPQYSQGKDYVTDLGYALLLVIGPDWIDPGNLTALRYDAPTLAWLNAQLSAADGKPCIIAAHPPLYKTVGYDVDPSTEFQSTTYGFYALPDQDIRSVLAVHDNAICWISGHTHSPLTTTDFVKREPVGSRHIVHINASCVAYTKITPARWYDQLATIYVTVEPDRIEVRFRDHGARQWVGGNPSHDRCVTVPL